MEDKKFKVRDLRHKEKLELDDIYLNSYAKYCGVNATLVYNSLCRHANFYTQTAFPSQWLIANEHNITIRRVRQGIKKLQEFNIIYAQQERDKKGHFKNYLYSLIDKSEWESLPCVKNPPTGKQARKNSTVGPLTVGGESPNKVDKDIKVDKTKEGLDKPTTPKRKDITFSKEVFNKILDAYQECCGIELKGAEFSPVQQDIKTMLISDRKPEEIIGCMRWLARGSEEWMENFTIKTVRMKIPFYLAKVNKRLKVKKY